MNLDKSETIETDDSRAKQLTRAKNSAYRLLTYRPRSRAELEQKLSDREFPPDIVSAVMAHLVQFGYIDDHKFSRQWAAARVRSRGYGRRRIEQELRQKGIDRETIREAVDEAVPAEDEREAANKAAEKKLKSMKSIEPFAKKRRLAGFLERKGFSGDIISSILRTVR